MNFHKIFVEIAIFTVLNGRPYVHGQRFLRSVCVNYFETLHEKGQTDFWYHSKWRSDSHLWCKHTWSHNLENVTWISFKLGSERLYRRGNMHSRHFLFSFKSGDRVAIFAFLSPILRVSPKRSWYRPVVFCSSSNHFTNFYTFSAELYRP